MVTIISYISFIFCYLFITLENNEGIDDEHQQKAKHDSFVVSEMAEWILERKGKKYAKRKWH